MRLIRNISDALRKSDVLIGHMVIGIVCIAAIVIATLSGCATTPQTQAQISATLQAQLTSFCAVAPNEVAAFEAGKAALPPGVQQALPSIQQFVMAECAPGVVANATTLQNFAQTVLPAFTAIALQYAASRQASNVK